MNMVQKGEKPLFLSGAKLPIFSEKTTGISAECRLFSYTGSSRSHPSFCSALQLPPTGIRMQRYWNGSFLKIPFHRKAARSPMTPPLRLYAAETKASPSRQRTVLQQRVPEHEKGACRAGRTEKYAKNLEISPEYLFLKDCKSHRMKKLRIFVRQSFYITTNPLQSCPVSAYYFALFSRLWPFGTKVAVPSPLSPS